MFTLRSATPEDEGFLYHLLVSSMRDYVAATWGWDEAFQQAFFRQHFDPTKLQVVLVGGQEAGVLAVELRPAEVWLASIQILPAYQRRGLGTKILEDVLAEARRLERPVTLQVLKVNPARALYERLGFRTVGETETHFLMKAAHDT